MKILINMDDHEYAEIKEGAEKFRSKDMVVPYLYKVIESGTILPKGHGDLVDRKQIIEHGDSKGFCDWYEELKYASTVIEADKDGDTE